MIYINHSESDGLFMSYDPFAHCVKNLKNISGIDYVLFN